MSNNCIYHWRKSVIISHFNWKICGFWMTFHPSILGSNHLKIFGGGGIDFFEEKNSLLPTKWEKKIICSKFRKNTLIHCYWPFKSWLIMKKILCRFAYGKKIIVSSKARKELFDPEKKSMASPPSTPMIFKWSLP